MKAGKIKLEEDVHAMSHHIVIISEFIHKGPLTIWKPWVVLGKRKTSRTYALTKVLG